MFYVKFSGILENYLYRQRKISSFPISRGFLLDVRLNYE